MKITIRNKLKTFLAGMLALLSITAVFVGTRLLTAGAQTDSYAFDEVNVKSTYYVGEKVNIGKVGVTVSGTRYEASTVVYSPDGSAKVTDSIVVAEEGEYTLGLRAQVNGKLYAENKTFTAVSKLYSVGNEKSSVKYGTDESKYQTGKKGLLLSLANNDTFTFNQVIDLKTLSKNDALIRLFSTPKTQGAYDARRFYVKLTDAYNPEIYVAMRAQCYPYDGGAWSYQNTYVTIEFTGYTTTDNFGIPFNHSFYAKGYSPVGEEYVTLSYDYENNTVYANGSCANERYADFGRLANDEVYPVVFPGFTTGEVFLSIYGVDYAAPDMNVVITDVAGIKLSKQEVEYGDSAIITVDTGDLDENALPYGIINKPYPVFEATAKDAYSDNVRLVTKVFYNYGNLSRYELDVKDGKFYPNKTGVYTIEYTAINAFGGKTVKALNAEVYASGNVLEINMDESGLSKSAKVGETVTVATFGKEVNVDETYCGVGSIDCYMRVEKDGKRVNMTKNTFVPTEAGVYRAIYTAVDMLGQTAEKSYEIEVSLDVKPIFSERIVLPRYFIANKTYALPEVIAYDFSADKAIVATPHITDKLGNALTVDGNSFIPRFEEDSVVYITYSAQNSSGTTESERFEIPVRVVRKDRKIDLTRYFDMDGGNLEATKDNIIFSDNKNFSATYIHPVLASSWSIDFSVDSGRNAFGTVDIYLYDYADPNISVKITVRKPDTEKGLTLLYVNGVKGEGNIKSGFYDDKTIRISYDKETLAIKYNTYSAPITVTEYGDEFNGFTSGKVYMRFAIGEVSGESAIRLNRIGTNSFSNDTKDYIAPNAELSGTPRVMNNINDEVTVYSAIAWDVLDANSVINVSVYYDAKPVTATDGTVMYQVSCDRNYTIKLTNYGQYNIRYVYEDSIGNKEEKNLYVYAEDREAPVLSTDDCVEVKSVGDTYKLSGVTAKDNVDKDIQVRCVVVRPDGKAEVTTEESITLEQIGKYSIVYYAEDSAGNYATVTKTVHVR